MADLAEFRHILTIPLEHTPTQVLGTPGGVYALCPDGREVLRIDVDRLSVAARIPVQGRIQGAVATPDGSSILVAVEQPHSLVVMDTAKGRVSRKVALPVAPAAWDATNAMAVVVAAQGDAVVRCSLGDGRIAGSTATGSRGGPVMFRKDGNAILVGQPEVKGIVTIDAATGTLLARLAIPFPPARFAVNADGGQVFVTGSPDDSLAIINTYQIEVDQTIIGGRMPRAMAVSSSRNLLLLANPASGDVTILDIETRRLAASVHVGGEPSEILLTQDEEYALVFNGSGDVAVIRMQTVLDRKVKTKPLFTVFSTAPQPTSAVIVPVAA